MSFPSNLPEAELRKELDDVLEMGRLYNSNLAKGLLQPALEPASALTMGAETRNGKMLKQLGKTDGLFAIMNALHDEVPSGAIEGLQQLDEFKESLKRPPAARLAQYVELDGRGYLRLNAQANRHALTFAYQKQTEAVQVAKEIVDRWKLCLSVGVPGIHKMDSVNAVIVKLEAGMMLKLGEDHELLVQIPHLEGPFRKAVESCLSLSRAGDWLEWGSEINAVLPERFTEVNAMELSAKQLASVLKEPLPKEWEKPTVDPLEHWRREVKETARGIESSVKDALRVGNLEIPSITQPEELIELLVKTAWGSGEASNCGYSIPRPSSRMQAALCEVLVLKNKAWTCDWEKLPTSVPPKRERRKSKGKGKSRKA